MRRGWGVGARFGAKPTLSGLASCGRGGYVLRSVRILIVDDNQDAAELLAMALEASGHDTRAVFDGTSAVATSVAWSPEIVLLDIGLPDIDGYEAAVQIRAAGRDPVLIALTGHAEPDRRRTAEAGFVCHLVKPVSLETLTKTLREYARVS